jgi:adenylate cyclase
VQIQAAAVEAMLRGNVPVRPIWAEFAEPIAAMGLGLICLLLAARSRPLAATLFAALICLGWSAAALAAVPGLSLLLDPAGPPIVAIAAFAAATLVRFVRDEWRARLLRLSFEQHLAPEVVRRIAADPAALRLRGEMREITALFTDIEGFTSMTERAEPTDLVALLDAYFDVATRIVTDHGGMIDKIVGDAIHAIYNAPWRCSKRPRKFGYHRSVSACGWAVRAWESKPGRPLWATLEAAGSWTTRRTATQ